jgi:hypothetical protein
MVKRSAAAKRKSKSVHAPKQRTREHVIASLSTNFVESLIYEEVYSAERVQNDYGFDLIMQTFSSEGYVEPWFVLLQLKATDAITFVENNTFVSFRISVSDYRTWMDEAYPVFLIVFDAQLRVGYWLYVQEYFAGDSSRRPGPKATTVTVRIPAGNVITGATIEYMKECKDKKKTKWKAVDNG